MKKTTYSILSLFAVAAVLACAGCGAKAPEGFPEVVPCTVTVTNSGAGLDGASVTLNPAEGTAAGSYVCTGTTDASGKTDIKTVWGTYSAKGVPAGSYKVTIIRDIPLNETMTKDELAHLNPTELQEHMAELEAERDAQGQIVPAALKSLTETPLTLSVEAGGGSLSVELTDYADGTEAAE